MFTYSPTRSASSKMACSSPPMLLSKAADQRRLDPTHRKGWPPRHRRRADSEHMLSGVLATRSLDVRSTSTMLSHGGSPAREVRDERASRDRSFTRRSHQADPGRFEDATVDRDPRRHLASPRTWRDDCYRSHRRTARRGAHAAGEPPHQDRTSDGPSLIDQDARRLRLLIPTLARQKPHHGARRAGVHRTLPWPAWNWKEPFVARARRPSRQG